MKLRVLLADDDEALRDALRRVLEARGIDVVGIASNGTEVVQMARDIAADVVLTDLRMPLMDGIEVAKQISATGPPPIVIILSAYGDPSLQEEARLAGASGWIQKGTRSRALYDQIVALTSAYGTGAAETA
ncbi:MAG TPA: response regulator transcription factor [Actinomycetota bacterium]|nr:response regulator transcription factor [Actinomycetota bacterium]